MKKKLPKVFVNRIEKKLTNNIDTYYSYKEAQPIIVNNSVKQNVIKHNETSMTVEEKIRSIFNSPNYVYKATVDIKLNDKTITKQVVGRNKLNLITIDNELINISDIVDINFTK